MRQGLDKNSVLKAAGELADQIGYEKVSLAALAAKLQIRTPSLYNHISGLPGLKKELACYAIHKLKGKLAESAIGKTGNEAVLSIGEAYVSFVRQHPGLYEATMGVPDFRNPEVEAAGNEIVDLILRVLQPFHLSELNAIHAVRGLRSIVHGFALLEIKKGFNMEVSTDETLAVILNTYITGLRSLRRMSGIMRKDE